MPKQIDGIEKNKKNNKVDLKKSRNIVLEALGENKQSPSVNPPKKIDSISRIKSTIKKFDPNPKKSSKEKKPKKQGISAEKKNKMKEIFSKEIDLTKKNKKKDINESAVNNSGLRAIDGINFLQPDSDKTVKSDAKKTPINIIKTPVKIKPVQANTKKIESEMKAEEKAKQKQAQELKKRIDAKLSEMEKDKLSFDELMAYKKDWKKNKQAEVHKTAVAEEQKDSQARNQSDDGSGNKPKETSDLLPVQNNTSKLKQSKEKPAGSSAIDKNLKYKHKKEIEEDEKKRHKNEQSQKELKKKEKEAERKAKEKEEKDSVRSKEKTKIEREAEKQKVLEEKKKKKELAKKDKEKRRKERAERIENIKLSISDFKNRAIDALVNAIWYTIYGLFGIAAVYLSLFMIVVRMDIESPATEFINQKLDFPAYFTEDGVVNYDSYKKIRDGVLNNDPDADTDTVRAAIIKSIILGKISARYGLNIDGSTLSDEDFMNSLKVLLVQDEEVNMVAINRIKKIKEMLNGGADFSEITNLGDGQGPISISSDNVDEKEYYKNLREMAPGEISGIIYSPDGYYLFKCFSKSRYQTALSYVKVDTKDFEQYLQEEISGFQIFSLVD